MKKPVYVCLVIIFFLMLSPSLSAQIYRYIDENGQKRWTDDLSQVPLEQRHSAEHFEEVKDNSQDASAGQETSQTVAIPSTDQPTDNTELTRESLLREKSALEKQRQALVEEREKIDQMKSEKDDASHRVKINQKISDYNAKSTQYEEQLNAYKARIEAYKQKVMPTADTQAP